MNSAIKIILVEDDQLLREICVKKLIVAGFNVATVIDGGEAIKKIKEEKPNLILLDIMLPALNGFEILKKLREDKDPNTAKTLVIVLSNLGQDSDMEKARELGANGYLIKAQFTTDEIVSEVKKVLKENGFI
ncbi:MAG: response regulator [bacterium]